VSYVDPVTVADPFTGTKAAASLLNTWRTDMDFLHNAKAGCRVRTNTGQGLPAMVTFELEDFDNQSCHSTVSNTSRITVPSGWAGLWWVGFTIRNSVAATFSVCLNGDTTAANALITQHTNSNTAVGTSAQASRAVRLAVGDYIELRGTTGTTQTSFNPVFWAQWKAA